MQPHAGLLGDLLAHCQGRLQQLRPATQAQLLQALVRVGFRPRPEWLSAYAQVRGGVLGMMPRRGFGGRGERRRLPSSFSIACPGGCAEEAWVWDAGATMAARC